MTVSGHWVHDLDPVAFRLGGGWAVRYYGLAYALSFVIWGLLLWLLRRKGKSPLGLDEAVVVLTALVFGVFVGGRVGYLAIYAFDNALARPGHIMDLGGGGMASHGVFVGVALAGWLAARHLKLSTLRLGDVLCALAPVAFVLGRLANFINGEGWGRESDLSWAIVFPLSAPPGTPVELIPPRHPVALYGVALEGIVLLGIIQWRLWCTNALDRPGRLMGEFLVLYAILRLACEAFREPGPARVLGLPPAVLGTVLVALTGIAVIVLSKRNSANEAGREARR